MNAANSWLYTAFSVVPNKVGTFRYCFTQRKRLNSPTLLVHVGNGFRRRMEEVRHDPNVAAIRISKDHHPVTLGGAALFRPQLAREVGLNR